MPRLAHISDLHFGRITEGVVQHLLGDLRQQSPDYLLVSGDITQRARKREFKEAARFFKDVPGKTFIVPGNHDIPGWAFWQRLTRPYARYMRYISSDINPVHLGTDILLVGFNTARRVVYHWNWSHGRISRSQFSSLKEIARIAGDVPKIAMFHHPIIPPPKGAAQRRVTRAEDFAEALSEAGFQLAISGHLHKGRITHVPDVYENVKEGLYAVEAGTATSSRLRTTPNEYNVIDIGVDGASVCIRRFNGMAFEDAETKSLKFT